jgi:hypothetical protein
MIGIPLQRFEEGKLLVSTIMAGDHPDFETAVSHPDYREGRWVIVQIYKTVRQAEKGHAKWVKTMQSEPLPESLEDVSCFWAARMLSDRIFQRKV